MIINRYAKGGGLSPRIVVTAATGSTVTCTKGGTTLTATEVSGKWTFNLNDFGTWTVNATLGGKSATKDVDVVWAQVYEVTLLFVDATLNNNDWETIKQVADASAGENYWAVGDTKQITINGKISDGLTLSNYQTYVYIIGFDHNKDVEGTGIAFQGFKTAQTGGKDIALRDSHYALGDLSGQWFNMNNTESNSGGWRSSHMRNTTIPIVKEAFPSELLAVIKTTTLYTDNIGGTSSSLSNVTTTQDDLYLLAEWEIFGVTSFSNAAERNYQQQYAYYAAGNSKIKYRHDETVTAIWWWERSVRLANAYGFCAVANNGVANNNTANLSHGLAPAFKVGSNPPQPTFNDNSWSQIIKACQNNTVPDTWNVGDQKTMTIGGTDYLIDIIGKNHDAYTSGGTAPLTFQMHDCYSVEYRMNNSGTNSGGWDSCEMRNTTLPSILSQMPYGVQVGIKQVDKKTSIGDATSTIKVSSDKLFLLSEIEVFGAPANSYSGEGEWYEYYQNGTSVANTQKTRNGAGSNWWTRSPTNGYYDSFINVQTNGSARSNYAAGATGVAFAFCF